MKKFYVFFLVLIVFSIQTSLAQSKKGELPNKFKKTHEKITSIDSNLVESVTVYLVDNSRKRYTYTYDDNGNMLTSTLENNYGSKWTTSERITKTFDEMGNVLTELTEQTPGDDWWYGVTSTTYTYDAKGNNLSYLEATFDDAYWKWVYEYKGTLEYDSQGNNTLWSEEILQNGEWVNEFRYTYTFDNNNNETSYLFELWQNEEWVNSSQATFTYDENGYYIKYFLERWQNGQWVNIQQNTYTNDSNGNLLLNLYETWQNEQWTSVARWSQTYDTNDNYLTWVEEEWVNGDWIVTQQEELTYDSNGNQLTYFYEAYTDGVLDFSEKDYYTYDSNGNEIYWKWTEMVDGVYEDRDQRISTYNDNGYLLTMLYQTWDGSQWTNSNSSLRFNDYKGRAFAFGGYKIEVTYQGTVGVEEEKGSVSNSLEIFPNPVSDYLNISYSLTQTGSIEIYDVLGNKVLISELKEKVDVSKLPEGVYYLLINSGNQIERTNFVIMR
ncbi:MAG: T9SS type A sorting domain-containing protein [bacterium]